MGSSLGGLGSFIASHFSIKDCKMDSSSEALVSSTSLIKRVSYLWFSFAFLPNVGLHISTDIVGEFLADRNMG